MSIPVDAMQAAKPTKPRTSHLPEGMEFGFINEDGSEERAGGNVPPQPSSPQHAGSGGIPSGPGLLLISSPPTIFGGLPCEQA